MTKGQRLIASMLAVIAILLVMSLLQGPPAAVASPQTDSAGAFHGWGIAVEEGGWALVKGADGRAYIVTPSGWRTAESIEHGRRGPLQLD
jgi:hypothetical protein